MLNILKILHVHQHVLWLEVNFGSKVLGCLETSDLETSDLRPQTSDPETSDLETQTLGHHYV